MLTDLDSTCWTGFMSAAASAKHENFVMSTSHTAQSGRRQTARSTLRMYVVHLAPWPVSNLPARPQGRYEGRWTCSPSLLAIAMVKQVEEALSASSRDRSGPNDTSKADWSQMARARNPWRHAEPATGPVRGAALAI
jgi:hypothetical protein